MNPIVLAQAPAVQVSTDTAIKGISADKAKAFLDKLSSQLSKSNETSMDAKEGLKIDQTNTEELQQVLTDLENIENLASELSDEELAVELFTLLSKIEGLISAYSDSNNGKAQTMSPDQSLLKDELKLLSQLLAKGEEVLKALKAGNQVDLEDAKGFQQFKDLLHALQSSGKKEGQTNLLDFLKEQIIKDIKEIKATAPTETKQPLQMRNVIQLDTRATEMVNPVQNVQGTEANASTTNPVNTTQQSSQVQSQVQPQVQSASSTSTVTQTETSAPTQTVRVTHLMEDMRAVITRQLRAGADLNGASLNIKVVPRHLGEIDIRLTTTDGKLTAELIATSAQTKEILDSQVSQLRQTLLNQGIDVDKVEIGQSGDSMFSGQQEREQQTSQLKRNLSNNSNAEFILEEEEEDAQNPESVISFKA